MLWTSSQHKLMALCSSESVNVTRLWSWQCHRARGKGEQCQRIIYNAI